MTVTVDGKLVTSGKDFVKEIGFDPKTLSKDLTSLLSRTAEEELNKAQRYDGFDRKPVVIVDNSYNKKEEQVKPFGTIKYISRVQDLSARLDESYKLLDRSSPQRTGQYKKNNIALFNGIKVADDVSSFANWVTSQQLKGWKDGDEVMFINVAPYARKLERFGISRSKGGDANISKPRGRFGKRKITVGIPNGAYAIARRHISKLIEGVGSVDKKYIYTPNTFGLKFTDPSIRTTFKSDNRPYVYPFIKIKIKTSGLIQ